VDDRDGTPRHPTVVAAAMMFGVVVLLVLLGLLSAR
jgi:hypothetical protein